MTPYKRKSRVSPPSARVKPVTPPVASPKTGVKPMTRESVPPVIVKVRGPTPSIVTAAVEVKITCVPVAPLVSRVPPAGPRDRGTVVSILYVVYQPKIPPLRV